MSFEPIASEAFDGLSAVCQSDPQRVSGRKEQGHAEATAGRRSESGVGWRPAATDAPESRGACRGGSALITMARRPSAARRVFVKRRKWGWSPGRRLPPFQCAVGAPWLTAPLG
jgi:hypothetical protein